MIRLQYDMKKDKWIEDLKLIDHKKIDDAIIHDLERNFQSQSSFNKNNLENNFNFAFQKFENTIKKVK